MGSQRFKLLFMKSKQLFTSQIVIITLLLIHEVLPCHVLFIVVNWGDMCSPPQPPKIIIPPLPIRNRPDHGLIRPITIVRFIPLMDGRLTDQNHLHITHSPRNLVSPRISLVYSNDQNLAIKDSINGIHYTYKLIVISVTSTVCWDRLCHVVHARSW